MAIYKDKLYHEQNMNGRKMADTIYNKFKEHLAAHGISFQEWGFNGKWYTAESTHANSFVPAWLQDLARRASNSPTQSLDATIGSNWPNGQVGRAVVGTQNTSDNSESPTNLSRSQAIYGGLTFVVSGIRYAILNMRFMRSLYYTYDDSNLSSYQWDSYYGTSWTSTVGGVVLVIDGTSQCDTQVGGLYENKSYSFWTAMGIGMHPSVLPSDQARFGGYGGMYDTWEILTIKTEETFFIGLRIAKPYGADNGYNYIGVGTFKVSPFFDNTSIGDIYYLYPCRRVTKMHQIMPTIDISKYANLTTDRSIFNGQMHPMQGDKILGKSPLYNWYVGYQTWGMIGRIQGIYGTVYNFGKDYVLLDGIQHQGTENLLPLWFGNTNVLKIN